MTIKAIETTYSDCRFRSRLEARWAVFFDAMGIQWRYEPEGFEVRSPFGEGGASWPYLPDFYLPATKTWVEVKGDLSVVDWDMVACCVDWYGSLPGIRDSDGTAAGLLFLGDIPSVSAWSVGSPIHPILQHCRGGLVRGAAFVPGGVCTAPVGHLVDDDYFDSSWMDGQAALASSVQKLIGGGARFEGESAGAAQLALAYRRARSARFEHGESPR